MDKMSALMINVQRTQHFVKSKDQKQMIDNLKEMGLLTPPQFSLACGKNASYSTNLR